MEPHLPMRSNNEQKQVRNCTKPHLSTSFMLPTIDKNAIQFSNGGTVLNRLFEEIRGALAETDVFAKENSPTIFLIYAHDPQDRPANRTAGAWYVRELIEHLKATRVRILSDRSPTLRQGYSLEGENIEERNAPIHDILSNQFCLLPEEALGIDARRADKVILCWSEVLQGYHEDSFMKQYAQEIKDFYCRAEYENQNPKYIQDGIREIVKINHEKSGFHHVLTELALVETRAIKIGDIIPIMLSGNGVTSLPYFAASEPGYLKAQLSEEMLDRCQVVHKLFFNLLRRIYEDEQECIDEFQNCYNICAKIVSSKTDMLWDDFRRKVNSEINKALRVWRDHNIAAVRYTAVSASTKHAGLDALAFQEMNYREQEIREAFEDTATWITKHESYVRWITSSRGILGVRGKPGSGKSTLMKKLFQILCTSSDNCAQIAFFYHRRGATIQYSQIGMYRTLLHQLLSHIPAAGVEFWKLVEDKKRYERKSGTDWDWRLVELQQSFWAALLRVPKKQNLRIFVDALDEAGDEAAQAVIEEFHKINKKLIQSDAHVSICFSSRHFPNLTLTEDYRVCVEDNNQQDISAYVSSTLEYKLHFRHTPDSKQEVLETLKSHIIDSAAGVFIWVTFAVDFVVKEWNNSSSLKETQQILRKIPKEVFDIYRHIFTEVVEQSKTSRTLHLIQWILFAERPLSLTELRIALALDDKSLEPGLHSYRDSETFIESDGTLKSQVHSLSGGLVEVKNHLGEYSRDNTTVQFIHQSVKEFLIEDRLRCLRIKTPEKAIGLGHDRLTRSCVKYLNLEWRRWKELMTHDIMHNTIWEDKLKAIPFCEYTIGFLFLHAERAEAYDVLQTDLIMQFKWPSNDIFEVWNQVYFAFHRTNIGIKRYSPYCDSTLFHLAAALNLNSVVTNLLDRRVFVEEIDTRGNTAMHYAATKGCDSIMKILLDAGALAGPINYDRETPLVFAAQNGHISIVKRLLDLGEDINAPSGESGNALQATAKAAQTSVVWFLLKMGAKVNAQGGYYGNALQAAAARSNSKEIVQLLLDAGADVNAQGGYYGNALQAAALSNSKEIVQLLLDAGADVNAQGGSYGNALQAAARNYSEIIQLLLDAGADVNAQGGLYGNALQAAALSNSKEIIQLLLDAGADVNAQGGLYGNALQAAVHRLCEGRLNEKRERVVKLLLDAGANVEAVEEKYWGEFQARAKGRAKGMESSLPDSQRRRYESLLQFVSKYRVDPEENAFAPPGVGFAGADDEDSAPSKLKRKRQE